MIYFLKIFVIKFVCNRCQTKFFLTINFINMYVVEYVCKKNSFKKIFRKSIVLNISLKVFFKTNSKTNHVNFIQIVELFAFVNYDIDYNFRL